MRQVVGPDRLLLCREVCVGEGVGYGPALSLLCQAALDDADRRGVPVCCLHQVGGWLALLVVVAGHRGVPVCCLHQAGGAWLAERAGGGDDSCC